VSVVVHVASRTALNMVFFDQHCCARVVAAAVAALGAVANVDLSMPVEYSLQFPFEVSNSISMQLAEALHASAHAPMVCDDADDVVYPDTVPSKTALVQPAMYDAVASDPVSFRLASRVYRLVRLFDGAISTRFGFDSPLVVAPLSDVSR
jgi:hypothetical protein